MNPYWGADFFSFFALFFSRFGNPLAADEVQVWTLILVGGACSFLAPFLLLRQMSMLANSMTHTLLLGIVVVFLFTGSLAFPSLFLGAFVAALLTTYFSESLTKYFRLAPDASVALIFTSLFALALFLLSFFAKTVHLGTEAVMGNVDALSYDDLYVALGVFCINAILFSLGYYRFLQFAFDKGAKGVLHLLLIALMAITCVAAFRAVGILLVLSYLIGPYLIARLFLHRLSHILMAAPLIAALLSLVGVALSRHILTCYGVPLSTAAIISTLMGVAYCISSATYVRVAR